MRSIAVRYDSGEGPTVTNLNRAFRLEHGDVGGNVGGDGDGDGGMDPAVPDRPATIAGIVALLVFALLCGLTALGTVAAQDVLGLSLPPYLQFLFAVTGFWLRQLWPWPCAEWSCK